MNKIIVAFLPFLAVWSLATAQTAGDATTGRVLAEKNCIYCHGPDGSGDNNVLVFRH